MRTLTSLLAIALLISGCSSQSGATLSDHEAKVLAETALDDPDYTLPLGSFFLRNGLDPDQNDVESQNLYGRIKHQSLRAAEAAGLITLDVRPPNMFGGELNQRTTAAVIEPLPEYVDRSALPKSLVVSAGQRVCSESVSLTEIEGASSSEHPVFTYECKMSFTPNPFGENFEKFAEQAGYELKPQYWMREGKAKFLLEWDNFSTAYKVSTFSTIALEESSWPEDIDKRIALLRTSQP